MVIEDGDARTLAATDVNLDGHPDIVSLGWRRDATDFHGDGRPAVAIADYTFGLLTLLGNDCSPPKTTMTSTTTTLPCNTLGNQHRYEWKVRRNRRSQGEDRFRIKCILTPNSHRGGEIDPPNDESEVTLAQAGESCLGDTIAPGTCGSQGDGYRCVLESQRSGVSRLLFKRSGSSFRLIIRGAHADLGCLRDGVDNRAPGLSVGWPSLAACRTSPACTRARPLQEPSLRIFARATADNVVIRYGGCFACSGRSKAWCGSLWVF
jgi:hypothetical protein